jgi:hypothetical protein
MDSLKYHWGPPCPTLLRHSSARNLKNALQPFPKKFASSSPLPSAPSPGSANHTTTNSSGKTTARTVSNWAASQAAPSGNSGAATPTLGEWLPLETYTVTAPSIEGCRPPSPPPSRPSSVPVPSTRLLMVGGDAILFSSGAS